MNIRASLLIVALVWPLAAVATFAVAQEEKSGAKSAPHGDQPAAASSKSDDRSKSGDGHAAAHHEDLGHGNASPTLSDLVDPRFDMSIYSFIVFLILLGVLYKFAWGPIATALDQREQTIARQIEEARLASDRAAAQLREYEARLAAATDEARHIVAGARKDAEVAKDKIVAEARDAAQRERDRAVADITVAKNQALDQIAQKSVQTAVSLASNIIRREVKPQEHEALIGEAINQFSKLN